VGEQTFLHFVLQELFLFLTPAIKFLLKINLMLEILVIGVRVVEDFLGAAAK
jgi:hypothetical protein